MKEHILVQVVAGCVIQRDDKFLLVQEKQPKAYGLWNLPAGRVDVGEAFEEAAIRETKEETGFTVEIQQEIQTVHTAVDRPVLHAYKAQIISGGLRVNVSDLLDVRWFTFEEIKQLQAGKKLRNDWVISSIQQAL